MTSEVTSAPSKVSDADASPKVTLDSKFVNQDGLALLSGMQTLVRLLLEQAALDRRNGLNTRGFVTGYRGSPLGGLDNALLGAKRWLDEAGIVFQPGLNEDLAATSVAGTQQLKIYDDADLDGVFGVWYGKGPGVDRSLDAFKHLSMAGTSPNGGVLLLVGDDPSAKSSTVAHQSEQALSSVGIPVLYPASIAEFVPLGLHAIAMSRHSGCAVALKVVTDTGDSAAVLDLGQLVPKMVSPASQPDVHIRASEFAYAEQERRLAEVKLPAAVAYARANHLNHPLIEPTRKRLGIIAVGKAVVDTLEALRLLGLDNATAAEAGIGLFKVVMSWPLEPESIAAFAEGYEELLVVEEKRDLVESQVATVLYNQSQRPHLFGKRDALGNMLLPSHGVLWPQLIGTAIRARAQALNLIGLIPEVKLAELPVLPQAIPGRTPWYCAGCPHNSSTKLPDGSLGGTGLGCHGMATFIDRERVTPMTQMGGEGATWIGRAPFSKRRHVFQNLGDGTYMHSGSLAVRAALAAHVNITFKILYNDAVAMTGGQPIEGTPTPWSIAQQLRAEGVRRIEVVTDEPDKYTSETHWPDGVRVHHRRELMNLQTELREVPGVTAIIYDQTCATEKRRRRKRGTLVEPAKRLFINEQVCEGCGDCGIKSNCVAVKPLDTVYGTKRIIDQSVCNKDYSCQTGFCPSFVSVIGQERDPMKGRKHEIKPAPGDLPAPPAVHALERWSGIITGIGGTGVVTISALLAMSARLENKHALVLDQTGLAQKNGAVVSHVRIGSESILEGAPRIPGGQADLLIACDLLTGVSDTILGILKPGAAHALANNRPEPLADFARDAKRRVEAEPLLQRLTSRISGSHIHAAEVGVLATALVGDSIGANPMMLGYGVQLGLIPLSPASLEAAIRLNAVAVPLNLTAFQWGRWMAVDPELVRRAAAVTEPETDANLDYDSLVARYTGFLTAYQNAAYASVFVEQMKRMAAAEEAISPGVRTLSKVAARALFRAMAYKDEYEVARLHADPAFRQKLQAQFEGPFKLEFHLAPPLLSRHDKATGEPRKIAFGGWILPVFSVIARMKFLRGTAFDPFGWTAERRMERQLAREVAGLIEKVAQGLKKDNLDAAQKLLNVPLTINGYGPVKERKLKSARKEWDTALAAFTSPQ